MKKRGRSKWRRAAFTVEAAFVVPAAVMLTALLIVLCFYMHDLCWFRCAALEAALSGNRPVKTEVSEAEGAALRLAEQRIEEQLMPGSAPSAEVRRTSAATEVTFAGKRYTLFADELPAFSVREQAARVRPERLLRLHWILGEKEAES